MVIVNDKYSFVSDCASRGFHEYRRGWAPRMGRRL